MVGPVSDAERASFARKLRVGVAALVAASAGLTALRVGASPTVTGGAVLVGVAVGWVLARFVVPSTDSPAGRQRERRERVRENPFDDSGSDGAESGSDGTDSSRTARRRNS